MFSSNTTQTSGGYEIQRSLRFNSADSAYLIRTPASAGNRRTWTWSGWVKRSGLGTRQQIFNARPGASEVIEFQTDNTIQMLDFTGGFIYQISTTPVYRDPSAWYHIVWTKDTTQATDTNRMKLYVNGVQVTTFNTASYPTLNSESYINNNVAHHLGTTETTDLFFNGYMTEVNFIDGQALTPSSFGEYNADTGVWQPKRYGGSYGTNGFYLNFSDNSNTTAATLGADYSGNGNNWTPNNFSVSAGAGNDSLVDTPTPYGVDTGVGGEVRGNYATLNPIIPASVALSNGNLDLTASVESNTYATLETGLTGKWYAEFTVNTSASSWPWIGTRKADSVLGGNGSAFYPGIGTGGEVGYLNNGSRYINGNQSAYGASFTTGDIIGIAVDSDNGATYFSKNGVFQNSGVPTSGASKTGAANTWTGGSQSFFIGVAVNSGASVNCNFGQRPFAYTAPSGFKALNTQNLPTPTIGATPATQAGKFFAPALYAGNNGTNTVTTGIDMSTNGALVWIKNRSTIIDHIWVDPVRGYNKYLSSNSTAAEDTFGFITSTSSNGFTVDTASNAINGSGSSYVAWNWAANGAGVTNTAGTITSTVSANTTSGFSVVTYTGTGANATVGHGLGAAPKFIIIKGRSGTTGWPVYSESVGNTRFGYLNTTEFFDVNSTAWNNTSPTSSVFTIGTGGLMNTSSATYVAYCFSEVPGYSKFGSYTGNGSADGPFVFTGMRPAYVMLKVSSVSGDWLVWDTSRNTFNVSNSILYPNLANSEATSSVVSIDILSNGFKIRTDVNGMNENGKTFIFAAFASAPQKFALAR